MSSHTYTERSYIHSISPTIDDDADTDDSTMTLRYIQFKNIPLTPLNYEKAKHNHTVKGATIEAKQTSPGQTI